MPQSCSEMTGIDKYAIAKELFPNYPDGFPFDADSFDLLSIDLPPGEDFGIKEEDETDEDLQMEQGFGSVIVVSGIPVVPSEKQEKLKAVLSKIFSQTGALIGLHMPVDESQTSKGFAFIEFSSPQEAQAAREQTNGYKLDKNHTFAVYMLDDFDKYSKVPDVYQPPEPKPFQAPDKLHSWMLDKFGRDQFVIRCGDMTEVHWNDGKKGRSDLVYQRQFWTESYVQWSPLGNFITTIHRQGAATWGGPKWERLQRFAHQNLRLIAYSTNESYLVTYSSHEPSARESATVTINIFDTRTAKKLRVFEGPADEYAVGASSAGGAMQWPIFKWAGGKDDLYFARLSKNAISVYAAPDMGLLEKRSLKLEAVQDFAWSPSEPLIAAYTSEQGNLPARIVLIRIPSREEVRQKNLFSVSDIKMYWHPQGDYLAVKVERFTKTKKSTYVGFELFSLRDKDIPMDVLELPNKNEKVISMAWEPKGHRFAVLHGDGPRPNVSFYSMKDEKGKPGVRLLCTLTNKACNLLSWSPAGRNIVLAGLKSLNGQLEFFNLDENETMATAEHFMATDVDWDPTGRYVATSVTSIHQMENGYKVWSFHGRLLHEASKDRLFQLSWRPRLPSLLPPEKEAEILKNLKSYTKRYEEEDEKLIEQADADVLAERKTWMDEWIQFKESKKEFVAKLEAFRRQMYGSKWDEKPSRMEKISVEQVVETKEERYK